MFAHRGSARITPADGAHLLKYGAARDRDDACRDATGLNYRQLCALVAVVVRHRLGLVTTRRTLDEFFVRTEGFGAGGAPIELTRKSYLRELGRDGGSMSYEPTRLGIAKVAGF